MSDHWMGSSCVSGARKGSTSLAPSGIVAANPNVAMTTDFETFRSQRDMAPAPSRLLPGFGSDELPVGIARGYVTREGPDVGDIGHLVRVAVDHVAAAVAGDGNE